MKKSLRWLNLLLIIFLLIINLLLIFNEKSLFFSNNNKIAEGFSKESKYVPGELIIKLKDNQPLFTIQSLSKPTKTNIASLNALNQKFKVSKIEKVIKKDKKDNELNKVYKLKLPTKTNLKKALLEYKKNPAIELVTLNYYFKLTDTPNDTYFANQWGLNNTGQTISIGGHNYSGTPGAHINTLKAWDIEKGLSSDVVVAIIDTGIQYNHEDLQSNMWDGGSSYPHHGWNFNANNNDPMDTYGHGTSCAGVVAAQTNNGKGIAGIAGGWSDSSKVKLMALKVSNDENIPLDKAIEAINFASDSSHKADIINLSFGILESGINSGAKNLLQTAINNAFSAGCMIVAGAGNDNKEEKFYPAACENVISVAATGYCESMEGPYVLDDRKACYSNYGTWVDISAPGTLIASTWKDNNYLYSNGTSLSAPMVSGTLALLKSKFSSFTQNQLIERIINTTDNIYWCNSNYLNKLGSGRVNAYKALLGVSVNSINPNYGANNTSVNVSISGMGFKDGATVKLSKEGESDIEGGEVEIKSSSQISCKFNLNGAKTGKWDVVVINPSEEPAVLTKGFTIYNPPPTVRAIYPNQHKNEGSVNVSITGDGFLAGAITKLTKEGQNDIVGTNIKVESSNKITCTFNLSNAMPGVWDVSVTNYESLSGVLNDGFTITGNTPSPSPSPSPSSPSSPSSTSVTKTTSSGSSLVWILIMGLFLCSLFNLLKYKY